jgi:RNA polymerase sigma-70 factor (ECF subfamily)
MAVSAQPDRPDRRATEKGSTGVIVQGRNRKTTQAANIAIDDRRLAMAPNASSGSTLPTETSPIPPFNSVNADSEQRAIAREHEVTHHQPAESRKQSSPDAEPQKSAGTETGAFAREGRPKYGSTMSRVLADDEEMVGLRARTTLDESPEAMRQVRLAIVRAKQGERDAIRLLYVRYAENVYGYVASILRDEKEAEDLTQHVFLKLINAIHKYDDRGVPFSAWLLRLARNAALDHLRRRRAIPAEEVFGADTHIDEGALDRARCLRAALSSLPEEQREVVVMRHVLGLTPPEIAAQTGRSESSIHGLHHRGRKALRQQLLRLGAGPSTAAAAA